MPRKPKIKSHKHIQATSISEYLDAQDTDLITPARITGNGEMKRLVNNEWIPQKEFAALYAVPVVINFSRSKNNPDSSRKYLQ